MKEESEALLSLKRIRKLNSEDKQALEALCHEIRETLIDAVSECGGHLSSNLGIVELTVGLHIAFDSPTDKLVFDVGHQGYVHKLLTGRYPLFKVLRQKGGLSGFLKRSESEHDAFQAGHSSTSISAALGMAYARDQAGLDYHVVPIIGDGALTGGMAFEALNHLGHCQKKVIVILNDNDMSISENVGGLNKHLSKIRTNPHYYKAKLDVQHLIKRIPKLGGAFVDAISRIKDGIKQVILPSMLFEELGMTYIGPVDGHNMKDILSALEMAKHVEGPVIVHFITQKGRGYAPALNNPEQFHGIGAFERSSGLVKGKSNSKGFSEVFGETLSRLASNDPKIIAISAAMPTGTGLKSFVKQFPDQFVDVGIAEQHAVTLAAGMAIQGLKPIFAVYSTFLQRAYDQVLHDVCIQNLPVVFAIDRAGLVGNDGETHHGVYDLAFLLHIPNLTLIAPKDGNDLRAALEFALDSPDGPVAIRYPRGTAYSYQESFQCTLEDEWDDQGSTVTLVAIGTMHAKATEAIKILSIQGIKVNLWSKKWLKDSRHGENLDKLKRSKQIITLEDHAIIGGYGQLLSALCQKEGMSIHFTHLGIPDTFVGHGDTEALFEELGLTPMNIAKTIVEVINETKTR